MKNLIINDKHRMVMNKYQNELLYPEGEPKPFCDDRCQELGDSVAGYIKTIKAVEERITEYEMCK